MHDKLRAEETHQRALDTLLFSYVAVSHISTGGVIRINGLRQSWGIVHMDGDIMLMVGENHGKSVAPTTYKTASDAVSAFKQQFELMGLKLHPMDEVEFLFPDHHTNVAVTWRHLKARFKGIKMILRKDRRIMEDIIDEAASM